MAAHRCDRAPSPPRVRSGPSTKLWGISCTASLAAQMNPCQPRSGTARPRRGSFCFNVAIRESAERAAARAALCCHLVLDSALREYELLRLRVQVVDAETPRAGLHLERLEALAGPHPARHVLDAVGSVDPHRPGHEGGPLL